MIKNKVVLFILFVILCVGFWMLFEYLVQTFITRHGFQPSLVDLSTPLAVGVVVGYFSFLRKDKPDKSKDKPDNKP